MLDHATGVVIGESAVVGDNVSMLHGVTLGGSGKGRGDRHPKIGNGVLLGAGAVILGPVSVGHCSKVGAGSVVLTDVPPRHVAVGGELIVEQARERKSKRRSLFVLLCFALLCIADGSNSSGNGD